MNKGGQKTGLQRGDRTRFPYEPRVIGGKLVMPAELQRIHRIILDAAEVEITEPGKVWREAGRGAIAQLEMALAPTGSAGRAPRVSVSAISGRGRSKHG